MTNRFLDGRVAVITGGARGLGRAMAVALGAAGARIALADVQPLDASLQVLRAAGCEAEAYTTNVASEESVSALASVVQQRFGRADIIVNAAGIVIRKRVTEMDLAEWQRVIDINLTGAFLVCKAFIPMLKAGKWGRIINITSVMAHISSPERAAYSASKFSLLGLTKSLASDLAADGITAVAISPGSFATEMTAALREDPVRNAALIARTPSGRWGTPDEIGALASFICSDGAAYINGTDIVIDGGWLAQ